MFKDRLLRGALAGIIASLFMLTWNFFSRYIVHFAKQTWLESLSQLVLGHSPKDIMDFIAAFGSFIIWNGFIGAIFVRFVVPDRDGSYLGRAVGYGFIWWFFLYTIGTMYKITTLNIVASLTVFSNWISVMIFGIVLGWLSKRWDVLEAEKRK